MCWRATGVESCRDPGFACLRSARGTWGSGVWEFQLHLLFLLLMSTRHSGLALGPAGLLFLCVEWHETRQWPRALTFKCKFSLHFGSLPGSRGQLSEAASRRLLGTRLGSRDGSRPSPPPPPSPPPVLAEGHDPVPGPVLPSPPQTSPWQGDALPGSVTPTQKPNSPSPPP